MNDNLMFEYLLQAGSAAPEQDDLERKRAMVAALRKASQTGPQGQMVGNHYVAPSITQYMAQLGNAYMAREAENLANKQARDLSNQRRLDLENLRRRMYGNAAPDLGVVGYTGPDRGDGF